MAELFSNLPGKLIENLVLGLITSFLFGALIAIIRNANAAFQASTQTASTWAERLRDSLNPFSGKSADGSYSLFIIASKFIGTSLRLAIIYAYPLFFLSGFAGLMIADTVFGVNIESTIVTNEMFMEYSLAGLALVLPLLIIRPIRNLIAKIGVFISTPIFLFLIFLLMYALSVLGIGWVASLVLALNGEATADALYQAVTCPLFEDSCDANLPEKAANIALLASFVTTAIGLYFSWQFWKRIIVEYVWD